MSTRFKKAFLNVSFHTDYCIVYVFLNFFNICEYFLINFYSTFVIVFFIE